MECPVTALIESRLKSTRRFSQRACRQWTLRNGLIFYRHSVTVTCCQSKLKSIPNFLLFFQFLLDLQGDLSVRSASNFVERRMRSTIYDSLFWVIYELVTRWRLKNFTLCNFCFNSLSISIPKYITTLHLNINKW